MSGVSKYCFHHAGLGRWQLLLLIGSSAIQGWSDTIPVTNTADSGEGSFRQAILTANANPGLDTIVFQINGTPPFTIFLTTTLPAISDPVVIDATTQPGYSGQPVIELNGAGSGPNAGLRFALGSSFSTLRGMALNQFPVQTIELLSASNRIQGNFIGTDITGTQARGSGNGSHAISIKSDGNLIGGTTAGDGNLISGGNDCGIYLLNANNNSVQGNLIGVTVDGTLSLSNLNHGIVINGGTGNLLGGPEPAAGNLISGNGQSGISLTGATATGNVIQGNRIGTDRAGGSALSNVGGDGITLSSAPGNLIYSNLISGNGRAGISISGAGASGNRLLANFVGTDVNGCTNLGNQFAGVEIIGAGGNQIGGTNAGDGNVLSGNMLDGIALTGGTATNLIQGNLIGLSAAGTNAVRNGQNGISINGGSANIVGGMVASARNIISGNAVYGVGILQLTDSGNTVLGNYIGTDVTGTRAIRNTQSGVQIQAIANTIGGTAAGAGNVISGNGQQGIFLAGSNGEVSGNLIQGNYIGVDATGAVRLGNGNAGIGLANAANNIIGGTTASARNVISANGNVGGVFFAYAGTTGNQLLGNYIGTDASGTVALGNLSDGVSLQQASANFIGGSSAGAGNLISGNGVDGIYLTEASWNVIQGNFIGTAADGTNALGNVYHNVEFQPDANHNTVGGVSPGAGNRIAFAQTSLRSGVRVRPGSMNNLISGNSIFGNALQGIDLDVFGVTGIYDCESGQPANAANGGQNFPILSSADSGTSTHISGSLNAKTGHAYTLQCFASPTGNATGYGQGQVFLGETSVTLGATCTSSFNADLPVSVAPGWVVAATATDDANNTSEFSAWVTVAPVSGAQLTLASSANPAGYLDTLTFSANITPPDAIGQVTFFVGATPISTNLVSAAVAASDSINNLPRGTNLIVAIYSGDVNYPGRTNSLAQIVTNHPPLAANTSYYRGAMVPYEINFSELLTHATDADGDTLAVSLGTSTNGITLSADGNRALYSNTNHVNDQFDYTVSDGFGGSATARVAIISEPFVTDQNAAIAVSGSTVTVSFAGIPGYSYAVQRSTNLTDWVTLVTTNTPADGRFDCTDAFGDLGGVPTAAYYRLQWNP